MVINTIVRTLLFVVSVTIIVGFVVLAAWGFWVMFFAWNLSATRDWARIVIIATSCFWLGVGGLLWLIPSRRRKS